MASQKVHMQTQDEQRRYRALCQPDWAGAILTTTPDPTRVKCDLCRAVMEGLGEGVSATVG